MSDKKFEREPALQPISRDHGVLLLLVQRLYKAAEATAEDRTALAQEIRSRLAGLVEEYLVDEEKSLSLMTFSDAVRQEIVLEHRKINSEIKRLAGIPAGKLKSKDFRALADLVDEHVRWDERVVMPYLQRELKDPERAELAQHTADVEAQRSRPTQKLHSSIKLDEAAGKAQTCACADSL
ncbi:MAG: hemerythrin domain-containing protein [Cyanobacteria bacterium SZAS LIN-2]|nr:hemerythrin domain-containing protein [Cyanobacteria bacterium SZAS LIN-2]MBS2009877.1 hemerythrin domain-containing protein [Cyanobacteria bacterium SZAS TMP-1]